ncbi:unnamed protein product [Rotaria magnacalcarata]|uniref:Uncharacterized protein n=2 Tax=Rotaria magnacalcarata TaxID=392030 RepID=A0A815WQ12_9BILA|nr:unnamed protein product [Rotaria magnacalcarata]CAF4176218.1 unnamed protein product [Rotaria magnacalcarata]
MGFKTNKVSNGDNLSQGKDSKEIPKWRDMNRKQRIKTVVMLTMKIIFLLGLLYLFVCSLDLMSSGFRLLGGKITGQVFSDGAILSNPIAGLMIGLLTTVIVQSSSTSTSIVVSMVSSSILPVKQAIPIIMGANIGTSVTNTLVALTQSGKREEFSLAFAGATVHDMFNWLTVLILLPVEIASNMLYHITEAITKSINLKQGSNSNPEFLTVITKPLTERIIQLDKKAIENIALGIASPNISLLKRYCSTKNESYNGTFDIVPDEYCSFLFAKVNWADWLIGLVLLIVSIICLCLCLFLLVKLLQSLLKGAVRNIIFKVVNSDFPGVFKHLTPYLAILVGCVLTILVQSSSIFTSTLTPLVGLGIITIDRVYPFTIGSNIGTTITGIMAALTATSEKDLRNSLQIALCHTFFNVIGILIWFPIPFMRFPVPMATHLGKITAKYRWFAVLYIVFSFLLMPLIVFGLSLAGWYVFAGVLGPIVVVIILIIIINVLQRYKPSFLPSPLRTWLWLPAPFRSLGFYDKYVFGKSCYICKKKVDVKTTDVESTHKNEAFNDDFVEYL